MQAAIIKARRTVLMTHKEGIVMGWIKHTIPGRLHWHRIGVLAFLLVLVLTSTAAAQEGNGYWYTVRRGDSWSSIAARTGVSIAELQRANPHAIHRFGWLYVGERIWIPRPGEPSGYWYTVQRGDSWTSIALRTGLSVRQLMRANPQAIHRRYWLYRGERIWIPTGAPTPMPTPTPTPISIACPSELTDYGTAVAAVLSDANGDTDILNSWLASCGAVTDDQSPVRKADLTGDGVDEVIVVLRAPESEMVAPPGDLLVLQSAGWDVAFQANAAGQVQILDIDDINEDGYMDIAWMETTCGAHTCFGTIYVTSWTDTGPQNWMDGTLTMAFPEVRLEDVMEGSGREIIVHGGVIGSVGAGPQRAWTEIWASINGAPYVLVEKIYDPSDCLYHTVLDANQAFLEGPGDDFAQAIALYRKALEDPTLIACWVRPNELEELRSFSAFRLAMAYAYRGDLESAEEAVRLLQEDYPDSVYAQIADIWWTAYQPTQDMEAACTAVNAFVTGSPPHPEAYEILADYGYANPTFTPMDVCPVLSP